MTAHLIQIERQDDGSRIERHYDRDGKLVQKVTIPAPGKVNNNFRRMRSHPAAQKKALTAAIRAKHKAGQKKQRRRKNRKGT